MTLRTLKDTGTILGLSTDTKPTNANDGVIFKETDTGKKSFFDAENSTWVNEYVPTGLTTLLSGEDQDNDVLDVETKFGYEIVARTTTDTAVGTTGAAGDILQRVIVQVVPTTADLVISDSGSGIEITIPTTAAIGDIFEVGCMCTTGWQVDLHATGAGTVACIGRFS